MTENYINPNPEPMIKGEGPNFSYCGYTHIGGRTEDQDFLAYEEANGRHIFIVCDGMGGHAGGCVASETATNEILESFKRQPAIMPTKDAIISAVEDANSAVYKKSQEEPRLRGMGTTLTLLVFDDTAAYITYVGDSRIYQLRKNKKIFRTFDNSMVFEQVAKGKLTEEEARVHPRGNILSKALGILPDIEVKVTKLDYKTNDRFILCCDGVWNSQPEPEIISMLTSNSDLETMIQTTKNLVEKIGLEKGGHHDNHTMIAVDMKNNSKYKKSFLSKILNIILKD